MIKSETAWVDGTGPEVLDVEVERLHDARREENGGAGCCQMPQRRNQRKVHGECTGKQTDRFRTRCALTWLLLGLGEGAGLAGDEHAGAGALALGAGRGEEQGAHAGRGRRRLLRLLERGPRGRVEGGRRGTIAGGSFRPTDARAPRRRRRRGELLLPLMLEHLLLLQGIKLQGKKPRLRNHSALKKNQKGKAYASP